MSMLMKKASAVLSFACENAAEVFVSGDFNGWRVPGIPMLQVRPGYWEVEFPLRPGSYRYCFFGMGHSQAGHHDNHALGCRVLGPQRELVVD